MGLFTFQILVYKVLLILTEKNIVRFPLFKGLVKVCLNLVVYVKVLCYYIKISLNSFM